jgi:hypothetical protein
MHADSRPGSIAVHTRLPGGSHTVHDARRVAGPHRGLPSWAWLVARGLGAGALLVAGAVHLQQYFGPYSAIPTIGTLFLVHFGAATAIGLALLAPLEHVAGRWAGALVALASAAGIALAGGSFVMLVVSERGPLFGFQEPGYDPSAIALTRASEIAAVILLGSSLAARFATATRKARW